jgi:hypothetical protein
VHIDTIFADIAAEMIRNAQRKRKRTSHSV